jgi:hypothetical protein
LRSREKCRKIHTNTIPTTDANTSSSADFIAKQQTVDVDDLQVKGAEVTRFKIHQASKNVLSFKRKVGDARRGHPARPFLSRELAVEHCAFVRNATREGSIIDLIEYEDDIVDSTVTRFIACISPAPRPALPTHDIVEIFDAGHRDFRATKIQWSMQELEDLYMFAHTIGAFDVCDMVIDQVHGVLHDRQQHLVHSTRGMTVDFNILSVSPAFLNLLSKKDKKGFDFFADVLTMNAEDTLALLKTAGLGNWRQRVKRALIEKLESDEASEVSKNDAVAICSKYHHHQGSGKGCYKLEVPEAPLVMLASALQQLPSPPPTPKKRIEPPRREEPPKNSKRRKLWASRLAFQKIERKAQKANGCVHPESNDERANTRLQEPQQEIYDEYEEYLERRRATRNVDGLKYRGEGMNLVKDTAKMQRKKVTIVKERLQMFHDYGYGSDSEKTRGRLEDRA